MNNKIYYVEHIYETDGLDEVKFIGTFTTIEKANEAIQLLITKPGFNKFDIECFNISEDKLNRIGWVDGFISIE